MFGCDLTLLLSTVGTIVPLTLLITYYAAPMPLIALFMSYDTYDTWYDIIRSITDQTRPVR